MPNLDGVSACHLIRQFDRTPIIAMTSNIRSDDIQLYFQHGTIHYLPHTLTILINVRYGRRSSKTIYAQESPRYARETSGPSQESTSRHRGFSTNGSRPNGSANFSRSLNQRGQLSWSITSCINEQLAVTWPVPGLIARPSQRAAGSRAICPGSSRPSSIRH